MPTAVPAALAIYNLVEDPWFARLKPEQYGGISNRIQNSSSVPEPDKTAILSFVACARQLDCPAPAGNRP